MKKLLSVLLSVAMIIGCISLCFGAFAEDSQEEIIAKFNEATKMAASEYQNEDGTTNYASGYTFSQKITALNANLFGDSLEQGGKNILVTLFQSKCPEFVDYDDDDEDNKSFDCYTDSTLNYQGQTIPNKVVNIKGVVRTLANIEANIEEVSAIKVAKFSNAADTLGDYALKETTLKSDYISNFKPIGSTGTYSVDCNDVDIAGDELTTDSIFADVLSKYPAFDGMDDRIKDEAKSRGMGITFTDFQLKLTNIQLMFTLDSNDKLDDMSLTYKVQGSVTFNYGGETITVSDILIEMQVTYNQFDHYNPDDGSINISELVKRINEGTAYAVESKAGYTYARTADYPYGTQDMAHFSLNLTPEKIQENLPDDSIVGQLLGSLPIDDILNNPTNIGITNVLITLDDIAGIKIDGVNWVCNCADCPECDCDSCTYEHPCTCTGCHCHAELIEATSVLGDGITALSDKLEEAVVGGVQDVFDFGAEGGVVPAGKDGSAYIGERALKATNLNVNDIATNRKPRFDASTGNIVFTMPTQTNPDENSPIAHLTDDYASAGDVMDAMKIGFLNTFGVNPFEPDGSANTGVVYTNIEVKVKFEEASSDNIYGNGKIESLNLYYWCTSNMSLLAGIVTGDFYSSVNSNYSEFNYKDYEKGDADVSGRVSIIDAKLVLKHIVGTETLSGLGFELADMNDDGELKVADAKAILQKVADDAAAAASGGSDTGDTGDTGSDTGDTTNG